MTPTPVAGSSAQSVGMGEMAVTRDPDALLVMYGLGSCVGVCAYDPLARVGGVLHVMLPPTSSPREPLTRYADSGVRRLLHAMQQEGAQLDRIEVRLVGGASVLALPGRPEATAIGARNTVAVRQTLAEFGLEPIAEDVGGSIGRSVEFIMRDGAVRVKLVGGQARRL
jgi:chemotaxis protein CheD